MEFLFKLLPVLVVVVFVVVIALVGYVKAPPDTAYMISGFRKPRILIGKAGIRIPFLERLDKLSLKCSPLMLRLQIMFQMQNT